MIKEGHIVGNHTVNHKSIPSLNQTELKDELMNLHTAIYEKFGYEFLPHTNRDFTKIVLKKNSINSTTLAKIINEKFNIEDEIEEENSILYLKKKNCYMKIFHLQQKGRRYALFIIFSAPRGHAVDRGYCLFVLL